MAASRQPSIQLFTVFPYSRMIELLGRRPVPGNELTLVRAPVIHQVADPYNGVQELVQSREALAEQGIPSVKRACVVLLVLASLQF